MDIELLKQFGFPVAMVCVMVLGFSWLGKIMVMHFIDTIRAQNEERKQMNDGFLGLLNEFKIQIIENTAVLKQLYDKIHHGKS